MQFSRAQFWSEVVAFIWMTQLIYPDAVTPSQHCQPAEEGQNHSLAFSWSPRKESAVVNIERTDYAVASCNLTSHCQDFLPGLFKTRISARQGDGDVSIEFTIINTSRDVEDNWYLIQEGEELLRCFVKVFKKARHISCTKTMSEDGLHVWCWVTSIYPQAKCHISLISLQLSKLIFYGAMDCNNEKLTGAPIYYKANCSATLPFKLLSPGHFNVSVTMFPNVSGEDTDIAFGTSHWLHVNLDYPTVKTIGCPDVVEENTEVACHCERSDDSIISVSPTWFDNNSHVIGPNNGSNVLKVTATRTRQAYQTVFACAIKSFGWGSSVVFYSPLIIVKAHNINCTEDHLADTLTEDHFADTIMFTCTTDKVYPSALCLFIMQNNQIILSDKVVYRNEKVSDAPECYKSTCVITTQSKHLSPGLHAVIVTMYPNVSGQISDVQFGANHSLHFIVGVTSSPMSQSILPAVFPYIGAGSVCVISILIAVCFYKQKASKNLLDMCVTCSDDTNKSNDYDVINDGYILAVQGVYQGAEDQINEGYCRVEAVSRDYDVIDDEAVAQTHDAVQGGLGDVGTEDNDTDSGHHIGVNAEQDTGFGGHYGHVSDVDVSMMNQAADDYLNNETSEYVVEDA